MSNNNTVITAEVSQRDKIFKKFLEMYFFDDWKNEDDENNKNKIKTSLELIVTATCNTKCSYCYYKNYGEELYSKNINNFKTIVENSRILFEWMKENRYKVKDISIFSGEFLNLPFYKEILEQCRDYFLYLNIEDGFISIPTNSTFLFSEEKTKEIEKIIEDFKKDKIHIGLSHSVDGKYLDNNTRALRNGDFYTDDFYEKLFAFAKKNYTGFHPMISAEGIDKWKENYLWYIENILPIVDNDFKIVARRLYLLEVRNPDWKKEDLIKLEEFILFLIEDIFQRLGRDKESFLDFIQCSGFNFFNSVSSKNGRGIGCSEQADFGVRLGDLAIVPCHRASYDGFNGGYFTVEDEKITDIVSENPETYILYKTFDATNGPKCITCPINNICSHYCMGTNMEVNKDFFIPVETVCRMEFIKAKSIVKGFMNIGVFDMLVDGFKKSSHSFFIKKEAQVKYLKSIIEKETKINGFFSN